VDLGVVAHVDGKAAPEEELPDACRVRIAPRQGAQLGGQALRVARAARLSLDD
jgi:hypothetical protein